MIRLFNLLDLLTPARKAKADQYLRIVNRWLPLTLLVVVITHILVFPRAQRLATVNITGIVNSFIEEQANSGLSNNDVRKNVQVFGKELEKIMHEIAIKKNAVLFPAEAIITGAQDYTEEVQKHLPIPKQQVISKQNKQKQQRQQVLSEERIVEDEVFPINQEEQKAPADYIQSR